jgi:hypothetical protein
MPATEAFIVGLHNLFKQISILEADFGNGSKDLTILCISKLRV